MGTSIFAQVIPTSVGMSQFSGEAGSSTVDAFSTFNNPACLTSTETLLGISLENYYLIEDLNQITLAGQHSFKLGTLGFGISRFGDELMNQNIANLGYAKQLSPSLSLGASLNYVHFSSIEADSKSTVYPQLGLQYIFSDNFSLGFQARNPFLQQLSGEFSENLSSNYSLGMEFSPNQKLATTAQITINSRFGSAASLGVQYQIVKNFEVYLGGLTSPSLFTGGFSFSLQQFEVGVGGNHHAKLGYSPIFIAQTAW